MSRKLKATVRAPGEVPALLEWIAEAMRRYLPGGAIVVTLEREKRTLDQNAKFHAICNDLEKLGVEWAGKPRSATQWKVLLISAHAIATHAESEIVRGLEGEFVELRESSASMSKKRSSSLLDYTLAWCAQHGVNL